MKSMVSTVYIHVFVFRGMLPYYVQMENFFKLEMIKQLQAIKESDKTWNAWVQQ